MICKGTNLSLMTLYKLFSYHDWFIMHLRGMTGLQYQNPCGNRSCQASHACTRVNSGEHTTLFHFPTLHALHSQIFSIYNPYCSKGTIFRNCYQSRLIYETNESVVMQRCVGSPVVIARTVP